MIKRLRIRGFKCFDDEDFLVTPLTLLSGLNSSGKSTFIHAIRLIYGYNGPLVGYGPLSELVSSLHKKFEIIMTSDTEYYYDYPEDKNYDYPYVIPTSATYISAARLGPELHLPLDVETGDDNVGSRGEFVLNLLERHSELAGVPEILQRKEAKSSSVRLNVSSWLSVVSPGITFELHPIPKADLVRAEYSTHRPSNVGFGVSYTLPIITQVLIDSALINTGQENSTVILIENPEAHLHPAGQAKLGEFIARAASCGVQCIVETHSDHLLNGIRLAVKENILAHKDTTFYYFSYNFTEEKTFVQKPEIDEHGFFDEWPDGFFDETDKFFQRILR